MAPDGQPSAGAISRQAVRTWKETAVPFVQNTVEQSRQVLVLDAQIQATAAQQAQALARQSQVDNLSRVLQDWANSLETLPPGDPIGELKRQEIQALLAGATAGLPVSDLAGSRLQSRLLSGEMPADATASDYLSETQSTLAILQAVSGSQQAQAADLETALAELKERYSSASQTSYSLSANLVVEIHQNRPQKSSACVRPARSSSSAPSWD